MRGFVWNQFRFRRSRALVLGLAILVAALSFVLLTSVAKSSSLHVRGSLKSNFRPAYDVLVRPRDSKTTLERQRGLVPPNYLSGIFGGISVSQWRQILGIRGVEVAAPVANLGYVLPYGYPKVSLTGYLIDARHQIFRVRTYWLAHHGRSRYEGRFNEYVYVTKNAASLPHTGTFEEYVRGRGQPALPCDGFAQFGRTHSETSPFYFLPYLECFSTRSPDARLTGFGNSWNGKGVGAVSTAYFPLLLSAIDPVQEARLIRLPRTVVSGRYLRENEDASFDQQCLNCAGDLPVLVGTRTYVDEPLVFKIERLRLPSANNLLHALEKPTAPRFLASLHGETVATKRFSSASMYAPVLERMKAHSLALGVGVGSYWTNESVKYRAVGTDRLRAKPVQNSRSVWRNNREASGWFPAPPGTEDTNFRPLHAHTDNQTSCGSLSVGFVSVGRFDQTRLPGFSPLSRVPLETYSPPEVDPADTASEQALKGLPMGPTMNLADYVAQPPFLLTSLRAATRFLGRWVKPRSCVFNEHPFIFQNTSYAAPISVIRVRVKGVTGPDQLSLERIKVVAQKIHDETGLDVDITAGSSPHPLLIELPAGKFGRPELLLREGWSKKGVSVSFLRALDHKDVLLFALILVICALFLSNGALAAVRARRAEIGTLRTLGWPGAAIFAVVLTELLFVGLLAGLLGAFLAFLLVIGFDLDLDLWRVIFVVPLAVGLALLAGVVPALLAGRGQPLDALRAPVADGGRLRRVRNVLSLAAANLRRLPARTLLGAAGLFVGVVALTVLVAIERSFGGTLVGTLLGNAISVQVRGSDFVAVGLTILLAGVSVADVLYLNLRERSAELATLRAIGWSDAQIRATVVLEAVGIGALGSFAGAGIGVALGAALLGVSVVTLLVAAAIAAAGGIGVAVVASLVPLSQIGRLTPHAVLAAE